MEQRAFRRQAELAGAAQNRSTIWLSQAESDRDQLQRVIVSTKNDPHRC